MSYALSKASLDELSGVHADLVRVVKRAIEITRQDFKVIAGMRTEAEQNALYRRGASQLDGYQRRSNHQCKADGMGHAVDLQPYPPGGDADGDGTLNFADWDAHYPIAVAMRAAALELGVRIKWGGNWYEAMNDYPGGSEADMRAAVERYKAAHPGSDFIDGPHFELS